MPIRDRWIAGRAILIEFEKLALPCEATFPASGALVRYRGGGGTRPPPLPDLYIGAQAAVADLTVITRELRRHRSCFPWPRPPAPKQED